MTFLSGYMSLEYAVHGQYSIKSDIFSFGVLILEIISGEKNRRFRHPEQHLNLLGHVSMKNGNVLIYVVKRKF
jgi:serine/threonine protein kinase